MRVRLRWKAIEEENRAVKQVRQNGKRYTPEVYANGDTKKQLLARSRYLLSNQVLNGPTVRNNERLFCLNSFQNPDRLRSHHVLRGIYETSKTREEAQRGFQTGFNGLMPQSLIRSRRPPTTWKTTCQPSSTTSQTVPPTPLLNPSMPSSKGFVLCFVRHRQEVLPVSCCQTLRLNLATPTNLRVIRAAT